MTSKIENKFSIFDTPYVVLIKDVITMSVEGKKSNGQYLNMGKLASFGEEKEREERREKSEETRDRRGRLLSLFPIQFVL